MTNKKPSTPPAPAADELAQLLAESVTVTFAAEDRRHGSPTPTTGGIGSRLSQLGLHVKDGGAWQPARKLVQPGTAQPGKHPEAGPVQGATTTAMHRLNAESVRAIVNRFEAEGWATSLQQEPGRFTVWAGPAGWDFVANGDGIRTDS